MKGFLHLLAGGVALMVLAACVIPPAPEPEFGIVHGPPSRAFVDATRSAGIEAVHRGEFAMDGVEGYLGVGQAWGDYDNDGWVDLFVTGNLAPNVLYRNLQDGRFAESP